MGSLQAGLVLFYVVPAILLTLGSNISGAMQGLLGDAAPLLSIYTFVFVLRPWHVARLIDFLITIGIYYGADKYLRGLSFDEHVQEDRIGLILGWSLLVRSALGIYTTIVAGYIVLTTLELPVFVADWWPW